jgi:hypothetical protein
MLVTRQGAGILFDETGMEQSAVMGTVGTKSAHIGGGLEM